MAHSKKVQGKDSVEVPVQVQSDEYKKALDEAMKNPIINKKVDTPNQEDEDFYDPERDDVKEKEKDKDKGKKKGKKTTKEILDEL